MPAGNHLLRDVAPIPAKAWEAIDDEARVRLTSLLAARRLTDWSGPGGWRADRLSLGRTSAVDGPPPGADVGGARFRQRRVLPLVEVRVPFGVRRDEIDDMQRGATDSKLDDLDRAARDAALIENRAVFHGWPAAGITGMTQQTSHAPAELGEDCTEYPTIVALAVDRMRFAGVGGPFALALSPERYTRIIETTEQGGQLLMDHLTRILGGEVVWAPGIDRGALVSQRGGDFLLEVGQDWSIGYESHDNEVVHLYLEQSFTFLCKEPDAAMAFR